MQIVLLKTRRFIKPNRYYLHKARVAQSVEQRFLESAGSRFKPEPWLRGGVCGL